MCVQGTASKDAMVDILDEHMVWLPQLVLTVTLVLIPDEPVWHWIDSNNNLLIWNSHREQRYTGSHVALFPTQDHHQQQHHACFTSDPKLFISKIWSCVKIRDATIQNLQWLFCQSDFYTWRRINYFSVVGCVCMSRSRMLKCFCQYPLNMYFDYL